MWIASDNEAVEDIPLGVEATTTSLLMSLLILTVHAVMGQSPPLLWLYHSHQQVKALVILLRSQPAVAWPKPCFLSVV